VVQNDDQNISNTNGSYRVCNKKWHSSSLWWKSQESIVVSNNFCRKYVRWTNHFLQISLLWITKQRLLSTVMFILINKFHHFLLSKFNIFIDESIFTLLITILQHLSMGDHRCCCHINDNTCWHLCSNIHQILLHLSTKVYSCTAPNNVDNGCSWNERKTLNDAVKRKRYVTKSLEKYISCYAFDCNFLCIVCYSINIIHMDAKKLGKTNIRQMVIV
jgi:hypothetical protein